MYGKIVDGSIVYAPNSIIINGYRVVNPSAEQYEVQGWFPISLSEPQHRDGFISIPTYEKVGSRIEQKWVYEAIPEPEPTQEERIAQLEEELRAAKILLGLEE